jgi:tellurite resistance protein TerC
MNMEHILAVTWMGTPAVVWAGFLAFLAVFLYIDLHVLHRDTHTVGMKESLLTTGAFAGMAVLFAIGLAYFEGHEPAMNFITGYVVEMSLSMDNIFVIALILGFFKIPRQLQHGVLFWGILGVVILRGIMIILGAVLIQQFHGIMYFFAAFLVYSGVKMLMVKEDDNPDLSNNKVLKFIKRFGRVTDDLHGHSFFVRLVDKTTGHYAMYMTPLFVALMMVELADVVFAVDSVPAIFAITQDPFIVFTSNIFAILGLRSLYFALSAVMERFAYVKISLAALLIFVGGKMFLEMLEWVHIPSLASLAITFAILAAGVGYSLWKTSDKPTQA